MQQAYEWTNAQLGKQEFEVQYSGSTAVTLLVLKDLLVTSNAGDSRCILYQKAEGSKWEAEELSRDHKPNIAGES